MNPDEKPIPPDLSGDELLRFLETPQVRSWNQQHLASQTEGSDAGLSSDEMLRFDRCGSLSDFLELVLGSADGDKSSRLLDHAVTCEPCGRLLAESLRVLEGDPSDEETAAIAGLVPASRAWQVDLAHRLAATRAQERPGLIHLVLGKNSKSGHLLISQLMAARNWRVVATVAAGIALAVGIFVWQRQFNSPEHLLAQAYSEQRSLELRIPGAGYASIADDGKTRGGTGDHEPAALLDARARLVRELQRAPQDAHWLQLQARADTLEQRYDSATDTLDRLLATSPLTADLLVDAASAYYERGLVSGSQLDRSTALDYLRRADELAPTDPIVLFNEAIVMEDRGQLINADEVWGRFLAVEKDPKWVAEGQKKRAVLEQVLNRLKSHESRIGQMLSSPDTMLTLAADKSRLASLDEELTYMKIGTLTNMAFPAQTQTLAGLQETARGSPCPSPCLAARTLLRSLATSLVEHHHDFWLSDLLSADIDSLPQDRAGRYAEALRTLGDTIQEDTTGNPSEAAKMALQAKHEFQQLFLANAAGGSLGIAATLGQERAGLEYMVALGRVTDFRGCRAYAKRLPLGGKVSDVGARYPWMQSVALVTEKICDDTPDTRAAGQVLEKRALKLAESSAYPLLISRVKSRIAGDAENAGDVEAAEALTLTALHELVAKDVPPFRVLGTYGEMGFLEFDSPRAYTGVTSIQENVAWAEMAHTDFVAASLHMELARAEMRIGAIQESQHQMQIAYREGRPSGTKAGSNFSQQEVLLAKAMLERSDLTQAEDYLDRAAPGMARGSDLWAWRNFSVARGQLQLARHDYDQAAMNLETEIRTNEGKNLRGEDKSATAEFAEQDHDLYAELVATWVAQGRSPASALALWERFRLRSRGLPVSICLGRDLDCELPQVLAAQRRLGDNVLTGQIVLLDRVLVYRVDRNRIVWTQKTVQRQDILNAAGALERAVSSPLTTQQTANVLGARLAAFLLPDIAADEGGDTELEPDPLLNNLPWPVLPTRNGSLGLRYSISESRSLLAPMQTPSHTVTGPALLIAASTAGEGQLPLPETLVEAQAIQRYFHAAQLLSGHEANSRQVGKELGIASVIHFAGHAIRSGNGTELLLSPSAGDKSPWIDGAFLRQHPPRACRLVVLSACSTGKRETAWNHPLQDMVETLSALGVPQVVATRWQIDSGAAVPFMDTFYRRLSQGDSATAALTYARRVQSSDYRFQNPYYWGAYYVTGVESMNLKGALYASYKEGSQGN